MINWTYFLDERQLILRLTPIHFRAQNVVGVRKLISE